MTVPVSMPNSGLTVTELFRYGEKVFADSVVHCYDPDRASSYTFGDFGHRVRRLASAIDDLTSGRGATVATLCWNSEAHLAAYFAVPAMGRVLHTLNMRLHPDHLVYMMTQAEDEVVIVESDLCGLLAEVLPRVPSVKYVIVSGHTDVEFSGVVPLEYEGVLAGHEPVSEFPEVSEGEAASLCFTTGTTGSPKGVAYSHRSIFIHALTISGGNVFAFASNDSLLPMVPMFHANAWGWIHAGWMGGADLVLAGRFLQPESIAGMMAAYRPTCAAAVPTIWTSLVRWADVNEIDLSSLRLAVAGGSPLGSALVEQMLSAHGLLLTQGWGMTETSPLVAYLGAPDDVRNPGEVSRVLQAGRLLPGIQLRLVDEQGAVLPWDDSSVGEIHLRGATIAERYSPVDWPDRFGDGWLRTGDLGSVSPNGIVDLKDRVKDGVKSGGEWISTIELEDAIASHPSVLDVAVIGVPDDKWVERPLAILKMRAGGSARDVREFLNGRVAKWWIPEQWVIMDELPRTSVGKYDKASMRSLIESEELKPEDVRSTG